MSSNDHERALTLLRTAWVEGISESDDRWLGMHLASCEGCASEAHALRSAVHTLRTATAAAPDELVRRTRLAVQLRAEQRRSRREPATLLWAAAACSIAWSVLLAPYTWAAFEWLGGTLRLPNPVWQTGFFTWWFIPATALGLAAAWRRSEPDRRLS